MATPDPDQHREDSSNNPVQKHYEDTMGSGAIQNKQSEAAQSLSTAETQAQGAATTSKDVREDETAPGGWLNNMSADGGNYKRPKLDTALAFAKKRGGLIGLIAIFGLTGGIIASFLGPASMIINLMENASIKNDASSTVLERRVLKVLGFATKEIDPICANRTNSLKCKMGRISNSALDKLEKKGIKAVFDNNKDNNERKKTGYPTKNPTKYVFPGDVEVGAPELVKYLEDNPKMARLVLGPGGAFNLKVTNWSGRYITQQFFDRFGLKKDGGIADGKNEKLSAQERYKATLEKFRASLPGSEKLSTISATVKEKVGGQLDRAKKGGTAYALSVAGCIGVKTPGYIASAVAAVQLAQVMPYGMDLVLSPGAKSKISGIDTANSMTPEDMDAAGVMLTNETPRESDGKMSSALNSPYLLAATGVDTGKPPVSQDYTPGYSVLISDFVQKSQEASEITEPACNVILSPAAMWSAFAVDSAITVAASATLIGGIVKVLGSLAITTVVTAVAEEVAGQAAKETVVALATNNKIPLSEGEDLGTVTGISILSNFSAQSAARHLNVLRESEVPAFEQVAKENEDFKKEMDVAALSPFDISSRYTFLGSMVNSIKLAVISTGNYSGSFSSILSSLAQLPSMAFSSKVGAAEYDSNICSYAEDFGLEAGSNTPATMFSGTSCYGLTDQQMALSTDQALTLVEPWLDESKTLNDTTNITDMVESEYIKADTPISEFVETCSDLSTGDYLLNAAGCTTPLAANTDSAANGCYEGPDGAQICTTTGEGAEAPTISPATTESLTAVSVALVDFQANQMINGTDVAVKKSGAGTALVGKPEGAVDEDRGWTLAPGVDYSQYACDPRTPVFEEAHVITVEPDSSPASGAIVKLCSIPVPFSSGDTTNGANLVASVISTNVMNMLEKARGEGKMIRLNDGFRIYFNPQPPYQSQHTTGLSMDLGVDGENTICRTGANSVTGWGSPQNAENVCRDRFGGAQYEAYKWLQANAASYGFFNLEVEPWHWSTSGR